MKSLRVLTIGHSYVIRLNRAVAAAVAREGSVELTVAAPQFYRGDLRDVSLELEQLPPPFRLEALRTRLSSWVHGFFYEPRRLNRLVREGNFDVVHAWEEPYILAGYQIARAVGPTRARYFFRTAQSLIKHYPPPFRWFESEAVARAQGWVAGGQLVQGAMLEKGFPKDHSRVITLGVDPREFKPDRAQGDEVLQRLGLQRPVIGYSGRLVPAKGIDVLLKALEQVKGPWSLLMVGSGPLKCEVERWAKKQGLQDRVRVVLAHHEEMPAYVNAFDLQVAPSQTTQTWKEQFGRMLVEAFACGVPVIGSDSGEIPFVLGDAGWVVPENDVKGWADAINQLLSSEQLRRQIGEAGLARCHERFVVEKIARNYVSFYRELMDVPLGARPIKESPVPS